MSLESPHSSETAAGSSKSAFSLENILGADHESVEHPSAPTEAQTAAEGWDEEVGQEQVAQGFCIECEGTSLAFSMLDFATTIRITRPARASVL